MPKASAAASPVPAEALLQVTAQQSRFHTDAIDAHTTKEILVKDISISLGQKELLSHAELHLKESGHYVLVGRNGTGKSTLLKAIAEGKVPGIPWSLKVLLLGQTKELEPEDGVSKLSLDEETVLENVVRSDRTRERLMREAKSTDNLKINAIQTRVNNQ